MKKATQVIILNGFLGSGKTTLFRNLLFQSNKKKIAVGAIVNDMSELDVDGEIIANTSAMEADEESLESISSHVISSKIGIEKLDYAIKQLLVKKNPELIIIETSGSCHPMPLIKYFKYQKKVKLTGVLVLLDCLMISHDFDDGKKLISDMQQNMAEGKRGPINLLVEQILFCNHLILTKSDKINNSKLQNIASHIKNINPYASIQSIVFGKLDIDNLSKLENYNYYNVAPLFEELKPILESENNSDRPYNLGTRVIKDDRPFHPERLWNVCHQYLDKKIYRSKGFFWLASRNSQSLLWNQAGGGINLELMGTWRAAVVEDKDNGLLDTEMQLLKEKLAEEAGRFGDRYCDITIIGDKNHINLFSEKLNSCFLSNEEIIQWKNGHIFKDPWPKNLVSINK